MKRFPRLGLAGSLLASLAGCSASVSSGQTVTRDSAGVEIVDNAEPVWPVGGGWTIGETPAVDIGGGTGPETDLVQVTGALRLADGRIVVATTNAVRIFDSAGAPLVTTGRPGSGPGEFQGIAGLWRGPSDSLLAADMMTQRMSILAPAGAYVRSFTLGQTGLPGAGGQFGMAIPVGQLGDGTIVGMRVAFDLTAKPEGSYRDSVSLLRYQPDGTGRDTVGRFPGIEMYQSTLSFNGRTMPAPAPVPLGKSTVTGVGADQVYVATNLQWEIEVRAPNGQLRRLIRARSPAVHITAAEIAAHRKEQLAILEATPQFRGIPPQMKDQFLERVNSAKYPDTKAWIAGIVPTADGTLWVEEVGSPGEARRRFVVLDADGRFLGKVQGPPDFRMTAAYPNAVIGIWKDANDVEHVRVYPVIRS